MPYYDIALVCTNCGQSYIVIRGSETEIVSLTCHKCGGPLAEPTTHDAQTVAPQYPTTSQATLSNNPINDQKKEPTNKHRTGVGGVVFLMFVINVLAMIVHQSVLSPIYNSLVASDVQPVFAIVSMGIVAAIMLAMVAIIFTNPKNAFLFGTGAVTFYAGLYLLCMWVTGFFSAFTELNSGIAYAIIFAASVTAMYVIVERIE